MIPRAALLAAAAALAACTSAPDERSRARPTPRGDPVGPAVTVELGPAGGELVSADGRLLLRVPAGAVAAPVVFGIQPIVNWAPGAIGGAYRLTPEGTVFEPQVTIVLLAGAGTPLDDVAVAYQDRDGYWLHRLGAVRDGGAGSIAVTTPHFSDWTLVTGPTERDLSGTFTIDSSMDPAVSATGAVTLTWAETGDSGDVFLLSGTVSAPPSLVAGGQACAPSPPASATMALRTNIAELRPAAPAEFAWGMSGHWALACDDAVARGLSLAFDTAGIGFLGCARGYDAAPVIGPDRVQGRYTIDCGPDGAVTGTWDFLGVRCGTACTPAASPCTLGVFDCAAGTAVCVDTGVADPAGDGRACTTGGGAPGTCSGGVCT